MRARRQPWRRQRLRSPIRARAETPPISGD